MTERREEEEEMMREIVKDNVVSEWMARISPMRERERGRERFDNRTMNKSQRWEREMNQMESM